MRTYDFDYTKYLDQLLPLLKELETSLAAGTLTPKHFTTIVRKYAKDQKHIFAKDMIVQAYRALAGTHGLAPFNEKLIHEMQMKPVRTISGVTPVTVLTKPFPCPGKCIFCPNDIRMPKSYLSNEPGAQRAERNLFDPYLQTYNRLSAFQNIGHKVDKVEIIVLGGTWSYYPEAYQIWFIKECFRALNDFGEGKNGSAEVEAHYRELEKNRKRKSDKYVMSSNPVENEKELVNQSIHGENIEKTYNQVVSELYTAPEKLGGFDAYQSATWDELQTQQKKNETAAHRNVGLVIETRPDNISKEEVLRIRKLGCTKTQIGFQSLSDNVLRMNKRGHDVAATRHAVNLLRQAGFKIHAHWMPNLYGSSVEMDKHDYIKLFDDPDFKPDELKIYPCSLIESAELMQQYQRGEWQPYTSEELLDVLSFCFLHTPQYCRLTRVVRDIPSTDIVTGNKKTNFREVVERDLERLHQKSQDIRSREVRGEVVTANTLLLSEVVYETTVSQEIFLQYVTKGDNKIVGFLRLSLPKIPNFIPELKDAAIIREVHVYGQTVGIGDKDEGKAQHLGLGTKLIARAKEITKEKNIPFLAVISSIGTREYYRKRGFEDGELYQRTAINI